jgi:anti-sigma B factor antagonist
MTATAVVRQQDRHPRAGFLTVMAEPNRFGAVVIAVRGDVDWITGPLIRDALLTQLRPTGPPLVIDLTDVDFLGAAGLTALETVREAAVAAGVRLCLVARTRVVLLPLTVTGLDRRFDIHPDLASVLSVPGDGPDG